LLKLGQLSVKTESDKNIYLSMKKDLPIFDIVLNDDDLKQGVGMISLVSDPAIGVNWIKLAKQEPIHFKADKEKQLLYGPFLIPNMLIYRSDDINGEYFVRFSKEEIEKIATKFNEDLNNRNINFEHTDEKIDGFVAQNWVIENDQDKSKGLGFDLPEGTWFGAVKIKDSEFWMSKVKSDEVRGFSVEILADLKLALKNKKQKMKEMKFKKKFIAKQKFDEAVETQMDELIVVAEEIAVGQECVVIMDDLSVVETFDGTVEVDGMEVVIEGGQITEVMNGEEAGEPVVEEELAGEEEGASTYATPAEVSQMIDARFAELMEEISALKGMVNGQTEEFKKTIDEKFKTTPAVESVKKQPMDEKFKNMEDRVRSFAKNNK
jgi:hypothetical protein